ncbi:MAG: LysR family transcriptional regulator [Firmicutes bacterium]|nr:LysR family transcriptional regulator [Bacillota bacterium]
MADIDKIRSFIAVARSGSYTAAAEDLLFTKSAVSKHIASLEEDFGFQLLKRGRKAKVQLTPRGEQMLPFFEAVSESWSRMEAKQKRLSASKDSLIVGTGFLSTNTPLFNSYREFKKIYPNCEIVEIKRDMDVIFDMMKSGEVDVAIVPLIGELGTRMEIIEEESQGQITAVPLYFTDERVIVNRKSPLARKKKISIQDIVARQEMKMLVPATQKLGIMSPRERVLREKTAKWGIRCPDIKVINMDHETYIPYAQMLIAEDRNYVMYSPLKLDNESVISIPSSDNFFTPCMVILKRNDKNPQEVDSFIDITKSSISKALKTQF